MKIDSTVKRETRYIALMAIALSLLMELVFIVIGQWSYKVLLGNILGAGVAVLNFFLMGLTVQNAVLLEEKEARDKMKLSMTLRSFLLMLTAVLGVVVPVFNAPATIIQLFFVRIAIALRPVFIKEKDEINVIFKFVFFLIREHNESTSSINNSGSPPLIVTSVILSLITSIVCQIERTSGFLLLTPLFFLSQQNAQLFEHIDVK